MYCGHRFRARRPQGVGLRLSCTSLNDRMHLFLCLQAHLEGKRPFVLVAVIRYRSASPPADYMHSQLPQQVKKSLSGSSSDASAIQSPLYGSFLRLCAAFKKLSAYAESIFAYTETVAALLDLKTMRLHTVAFGEGVIPAYVMASDGLELEPVQDQRHYVDHHIVKSRSYQGFAGQYHVLLGSSGLWCVSSLPSTR
eukprot:jgi/Ulvmu1/6032/UM027_0008.1